MTTTHLLQKKPLYEQVIDLIEAQIISGEIRVGDQLPTENDLAAYYQVSRTVIREAMKALKEKGWIETHVGKGTFVIDNVARGIDSSFDLALRMDSGSSFGYLIEVREILEPEIAALAALRANDEQLAKIRSSVEMMEQGLENKEYKMFLQGDLDFHVSLAEATGNPLVLMILNRVVTLMRAQQEYHVYHEPSGGKKSQQNHQLIMEALEKRDPKASRICMREHIRQVRTDVDKADTAGN
jgi:GntR family transcriptional regulator, transcriptional repressor for pyruvate dehydrogenase complex